jgi:hypothetical protein
MQLKHPSENKTTQKSLSIAEKLALAATALVGSGVNAQTSDENEWEFVGSVLIYSEAERVSALEGMLNADKYIGDSGKLSYKFVLDSLTGASANGAIAQQQVQTFTRPSGIGQYVIQAQNTPLDDTFKDTRAQFNVSWSDALSGDSRYTVGSNLSREFDYTSLSFNAEYAKDFDKKNTTLSFGASVASDRIKPEGGRPLAFSSMVIDSGQFVDQAAFDSEFDASRISGNGTIDSAEFLIGWTQVVSRRMIFQVNLNYANTDGYLTDPFKVLSVIDLNAISQDYVYESRPKARTQHSIFAMTKYHLDDSILDLSYRYFSDDWNIISHTLDFRWHLFSAGDNSSGTSFWEPHVRFYQQSAAEFYMPYLVEGQALPMFASADYRVGEMSAITLGLKYGFSLSGGNKVEIRGEYYKQSPKAATAEDVAAVDALDIYPEVDALIIQVTYFF